MSPEFERLRSLPIAEKLRLVEELWDDIHASNEPYPAPTWYREEAERRAAELDADPSKAIDENEMWRRVDARRA
jgi:putative addiction module component (TIGR02574 family)